MPRPAAVVEGFRGPPREVPATTRAWVGLDGGIGLAAWLAVGFSSIFFWSTS